MGSTAESTARQSSYRKLSSESSHSLSKYHPPEHRSETMLSEALRGTDRFPEAKQFNLLHDVGRENGRADMRLYYAGEPSLLGRPCVAIIGTRKVSDDGVRRTKRLARELVEAGIVIVSGLATGVDTVALTTAIDVGGQVVAVIGTPLDKAYPAENKRLQETIYRDHLLISQFASDERTFRSSFPQRNKLMAVLSDATVVMEASDTSGTLHQAAECTKLGRWLFVARSVMDDTSLEWPKKFQKYETCVPLEDVSDVTGRILKNVS